MLKKMIVMLAAGLCLAASFQAHAAKTVIAVNCAGGDADPFIADTNFSGGSTASYTNTITLTNATNPAPMKVYQSERWGAFSYLFDNTDGLAASKAYKVRLHFAENFNNIDANGKRVFSILINSNKVLTDFDIYSEAGGRDKALIKEFDVTTTGSAQIRIQTVAKTDNPKINGIEIVDPASDPDLLKVIPAVKTTSGFTQHGTTMSLSISNVSSAPVTVNRYRLGGSSVVFTPPVAPLTINAKTTTTIKLFCRSSFSETYNGQLNIDYNNSAQTILAKLGYTSMNYAVDWTDLDVGGAAPSTGSAVAGTSNYTLKGGGRDIWDAADQFNYMYRSTIGNFTITANVASLENTNAWAKAGLMVRESLDPNSKMLMIVVTPSNGLAFQYRAMTGGGCGDAATAVANITAPVRVRMARSGNTYTGSYSRDNGATWTTMGSITLDLSTNGVAGLALTSHDATKLGTAVFDNVNLDYVADPSYVVNSVRNWTAFE